MSKFNKTIISIVLLIIVITSVIISYLTYSPFKKAEQAVKDQIIFYNGQENYGNGFSEIDLRVKVNTQTRWELVPLNNNWKQPLNPVYSLVFNEYKDKKGLSVAVFELERNNLFIKDWSVKQYRMNQLNNYQFDDTVELVKRQDISKSNPDTTNISNIPEFTPEEIEYNRKLREKDEEIKKKEEQQNQNQTQFNNSTVKEKIEILEKEIAIDKQLITCYNDYSKPIILKLEEVSKPSTQDPEKAIMEFLSPEEQQKIGDAYYKLQSIKEGEQLLECKLEDASIAKFTSSNYDNPTQTLEDSITSKTKALEELKTQ